MIKNEESMFGPLKRTETVPEQIAGILQRAILGGEIEIGQRLPSEKQLASQFETNRVSLRQALHMLKTNGLIEGGQGKAWRVSDFRQQGGMHLLPDLFEVQGFTEETAGIIRDFLGIRTPVLLQIMVVAIERMDEEQQDALREALSHLESLVAAKASPEALFLADLAWFEALLEASNSLLYRSMYRPFSDVYKRFSSAVALVWQPPESYPRELQAIQRAIEKRETVRAQNMLVTYLKEDSDRLLMYLDMATASFSTSVTPLPNTHSSNQKQEVLLQRQA
jgi:DNA-binding FadR family transcriptional regulator